MFTGFESSAANAVGLGKTPRSLAYSRQVVLAFGLVFLENLRRWACVTLHVSRADTVSSAPSLLLSSSASIHNASGT